MDLNKLKIFKTVYEEGSYTKAAEKIHISQPAVSIQIRNLEETFELKLFDKLGKTIVPTEAGEILYRYTIQIFQGVENARKALMDLKNLESGRLILGASTTPGTYILPETLGNLKKSFPGIKTRLKITNSQQVIKDIIDNKIDLGIIGGKKNYPLQIKSRTIFTDQLVVIAPPDFPLDGEEINLEELTGQKFIIREPGSSTRKYTQKLFNEIKGKAEISLELTGPEAVKEAVKSGLGLSLISKLSVKKTRNEGLKVYTLKGFDTRRPLDVIWHRDKHLNRLIKTFIDKLSSFVYSL